MRRKRLLSTMPLTKRQREYEALKIANELGKVAGSISSQLFRYGTDREGRIRSARQCFSDYAKKMGIALRDVEKKSVTRLEEEIIGESRNRLSQYAKNLGMNSKKSLAELADEVNDKVKELLVQGAEKEGIKVRYFLKDVPSLPPNLERFSKRIWKRSQSRIPMDELRRMARELKIPEKGKKRSQLAEEIWKKIPPMEPFIIYGTVIIKPVPLKLIYVWGNLIPRIKKVRELESFAEK